MKRFFSFCLILSAVLFLVISCSDDDEDDPINQTEECSYDDYKCKDGNSYRCGYSGWSLFQTCLGGCDSESGKCSEKSDSDNSEKPDQEAKDPENPEEPDGDSESVPDNSEDADNTEITGSDGDNPDDSNEIDAADSDDEPVNDSDDDADDSTPDENGDSDDNPETDEDSEDSNQDEDADSGEIENDDPISLGKLCTGQTLCYNASVSITCPASSETNFYGQDAQYTEKCTSNTLTVETVSDDKVVVDNETKLVWEQSLSKNTYTWNNRATHCNELNSSNYGGKGDWRVPNPLELLTIVDNGKYNPATNPNFTNMPKSSTDYLWTSKAQGTTSNAFAFNPYRGSTYYESKTTGHYVICVSGEELPEGSFSILPTESAEKVVVDSATGLMWQKNYDSGTYNWQKALKHCEDLFYAGYDDWRLPNKNELSSLLNLDKSAAPYSNFPDMPKNRFWSSSTRVDNKFENAWVVMFAEGYVSGVEKTASYSVRCVR